MIAQAWARLGRWVLSRVGLSQVDGIWLGGARVFSVQHLESPCEIGMAFIHWVRRRGGFTATETSNRRSNRVSVFRRITERRARARLRTRLGRTSGATSKKDD